MGNSEQILQANHLSNYLSHKEEIDTAVSKVLSSGWYILGNEVSLFEQEFANYVGVKYGVGVGSGTEALHVALLSCGVSSRDEVITVSHTAVATVSAIELCGAKPVFVDINPQSYTMEPNQVESVITSHTKAIVPVHLYGHPVEIEPILAIAKRHGLMVIEDCAQAHGAIYKDKKVGSWGDIAAFSFYPTKNLGALGDGGIVVTNNPNLYERAKLIRQYGWKKRYISDISGMNSRLDELQASVLRVKLKYLDMENEKRRSCRMYDNTLNKSILNIPSESKMSNMFIICIGAIH